MDLSYAQHLEDYHLSLAFGDQKTGFYIDVGAGQTLTLTATFTHAYGDIDFRLWDACGATTPLVNANGNTNNNNKTNSNYVACVK